MARRHRKDKSLLQVAVEGDWKFSAVLAILILMATIFIPLLVTNKILVSILSTFQLVGYLAAGLFIMIAIVKLMKADSAAVEAYKKTTRQEPIFTPSNDPQVIEPQLREPIIETKEWTLKLIQDLEWKRFEELCVAIYNERGIRAVTTDLGADGGIDIKLYQADASEPSAIAQCKAWRGKVGVKPIREFLGVMTHERISKGYYLTPSGFTDEAKAIAKSNGLTLFSGDMILMMIKRLSQESQDKLINMITQGDYTTPSCAKCGIKMIRRSGKKGEFWGCANYPRCRQTLRLRAIDHEDRETEYHHLY